MGEKNPPPKQFISVFYTKTDFNSPLDWLSGVSGDIFLL